MYGFISNNLKSQINKYLESKLLTVDYKYTKPISEMDEIIKNITVDNLIVDSTCFYDDKAVVDFCYKLKILKPKIRIIIICFNTQLITDIAMLGIYDIINYQKKINLNNELDEILLTPKTLSDLQMYLNTDIIQNKNINCKIIGALSYEANSYLSTYLLNYAQIFKDKKVCYCETSNTKYSLSNYFNAKSYANLTTYNDEKFQYLNCDILFSNNSRLKKDAILTLLLNLRNKYEVVIFDLGCMPMPKINEDIISNCEELIIFKTNNIYNNYCEYDTSFQNKIVEIVDYKKLYDKNISGVKSEVINNYINMNFKVEKKTSINVKSDLKAVISKMKSHIKNQEVIDKI